MRRIGHMGQGAAGDISTRALADAYRCPDCHADATLTRDALGIWHLTVTHEATCPTYRRTTR